MTACKIRSISALLLLMILVVAGCSKGAPDFYTQAEKAYRAGDFNKAIELLTKGAQEMPNEPVIYDARAECYYKLGNLNAAMKDCETAIEKTLDRECDNDDSYIAHLYYRRAWLHEEMKNFEAAITDIEKTLLLDNKHPEARNGLAWVLATCPDSQLRAPQRAIELATIECEQRDWQDATVIDTLAAAYAAAGDFDSAVKWQLEALNLLQDDKLKNELEERLELYEEGKPYVDQKNSWSIIPG